MNPVSNIAAFQGVRPPGSKLTQKIEGGDFDFLNYLMQLDGPFAEGVLGEQKAPEGVGAPAPLTKKEIPNWFLYSNLPVVTNPLSTPQGQSQPLGQTPGEVKLNQLFGLNRVTEKGSQVEGSPVTPLKKERPEADATQLQANEVHRNVFGSWMPQAVVPAPVRGAQIKQYQLGEEKRMEGIQSRRPTQESLEIVAEKPDSKTTTKTGAKTHEFASAVMMSPNAPDFSLENAAPSNAAPVSINQITDQVRTLVFKGGGEITLSLDPPELGKLEIRVTTHGNQVEVEMISQNDLAKGMLQDSAPDLHSALEGQDLTLSRLEVSVANEMVSGFSLQHGFSQGLTRDHTERQGFERRENVPQKEIRVAEVREAPALSPAREGSPGLDIRV